MRTTQPVDQPVAQLVQRQLAQLAYGLDEVIDAVAETFVAPLDQAVGVEDQCGAIVKIGAGAVPLGVR